MPIGHPRWRLKLFLSLPVVLVLGAAAALAYFVAHWSATQSDAYSRAQEVHFVRAQLERRVAWITKNQQTVTIWTEAQKMIAGARDPEWFDGNLGVWLYNTYDFDRVFLLDEAEALGGIEELYCSGFHDDFLSIGTVVAGRPRAGTGQASKSRRKTERAGAR